MQITIPESISTRFRQLAARRSQPVEVIIADRLFTALDDELDDLQLVDKLNYVPCTIYPIIRRFF